MEILFTSKEMVKPSSEEVYLRKPFSLSFFDQIMPSHYLPFMFFYTKPNDSHFDTVETLAGLRKSLSKTLDQYYPFSGRTIDNRCIGSYDKGVPYVEARVKGCLADCIAQTEQEWMSQLLPCQPYCSIPASTSPLLAIQINAFDCGGIAVVMCCSHKVMDAATASTFVKSWAAFNRGSDGAIPDPDMLDIGSRLFPPLESIPQNYLSSIESLVFQEGWHTTRRFVFDDNAISALKSQAKSKRFEHPTRNVALVAYLWKYAMLASRVASGRSKPSVLTQAVNLRSRLKPRLPQYTIGNIFGTAVSTYNSADQDIELDHLAYLVREAIDIFNDQIPSLQSGEVAKFMNDQYNPPTDIAAHGEVDNFGCSNWLHTMDGKVDFGWGEATSLSMWRAETHYYSFFDTFIIKETGKDRDIEAVITLETKTMDVLEHNSEFLTFASPVSDPCPNKNKIYK